MIDRTYFHIQEIQRFYVVGILETEAPFCPTVYFISHFFHDLSTTNFSYEGTWKSSED